MVRFTVERTAIQEVGFSSTALPLHFICPLQRFTKRETMGKFRLFQFPSYPLSSAFLGNATSTGLTTEN